MVYQGTLAALQPSADPLATKITLNNGLKMPIVGFGTFTIRGRELIFKVVEAALLAGYRSFDTAAVYNNEEDIGDAFKTLLPKYNLKREDIFITSKLAPRDQGSSKVYDAVLRSLSALGVSYIDLFLIHWPGVSGIDVASRENKKLRTESWQGLVDLYRAGKLKAVGVSNYTSRHIHDLIAHSTVTPAVNQVEFHPHYRQAEDLLNLCAREGILLQAYSSLGGNSTSSVLEDPQVKEVAGKVGASPAQVVLRWALQMGFAIIPKSVNPERIKENAQLSFELEKEDLETITNIRHRQKYCWNPDTVF